MTETLSEFDVLELLGYRHSGRKWLEILGYEYSTQGLNEFRSIDHDIQSLLMLVVLGVLDHVGHFPRVERTNGMYLTRQSDGTIVCTERHTKDFWRKRTYASDSDAAIVLVHARCCRPELLPDVDLPKPIVTVTTPKWDRRNAYAR